MTTLTTLTTLTTFATPEEWFTMLADVFDLPLDNVSDEAKKMLWAKTYATHDAWVKSAKTS
jgi:hypothetical protein